MKDNIFLKRDAILSGGSSQTFRNDVLHSSSVSGSKLSKKEYSHDTRSVYSSTVKMEAVCFYESLVKVYQAIRHHIPRRYCTSYTVSKTLFMARHHQVVAQIITSSLERYWILFLAYELPQNRHTGDFVGHKGLFSSKVP
jgi:hypothetical protein